MTPVRVNGERLWDSLMEMAKIGATDRGGVRRLALTDVDKEARDLFVHWCKDAGCVIRIDRMGNIFARRPGADNSLLPVLTGSHIDSQPAGGKFDGIYGVLAGLEVVRTLNDLDIQTLAPVEICSWTNEEGARFPPAMIASGVFGGVFSLEEALASRDSSGITLGDELRRIGYAGTAECGGRTFRAFLELHIEQGPILEAEAATIGVVEGVQGIRWMDITLEGMDTHAGTTPMGRRRDALAGAARLITAIEDLAIQHQPEARATVGTIEVQPNSRNTVPGSARFSLDLRHPDTGHLDRLTEQVRHAALQIASASNLQVAIEDLWYSPPVRFAENCINAVREAADMLGLRHRPITSGAGHDAVHIARIAPTGMIFIPCKDGISHNETESATAEDVTAGANVLASAVVEVANRRDPN